MAQKTALTTAGVYCSTLHVTIVAERTSAAKRCALEVDERTLAAKRCALEVEIDAHSNGARYIFEDSNHN